MKNSTCVISEPKRHIAAMPLLLGLAVFVAAPAAQAVTFNEVDIIQGRFDVNENGIIDAADDLNNVAMWFDGAALAQVDIKDGLVDVNEGGSINTQDDLSNVDLNDENTVSGSGGVPSRNRVNIRDGLVDVDQDGVYGEIAHDALANVQLPVLP
jgi:predicted TIM-barrel enzyme